MHGRAPTPLAGVCARAGAADGVLRAASGGPSGSLALRARAVNRRILSAISYNVYTPNTALGLRSTLCPWRKLSISEMPFKDPRPNYFKSARLFALAHTWRQQRSDVRPPLERPTSGRSGPSLSWKCRSSHASLPLRRWLALRSRRHRCCLPSGSALRRRGVSVLPS